MVTVFGIGSNLDFFYDHHMLRFLALQIVVLFDIIKKTISHCFIEFKVAVEPTDSPVIAQALAGEEIKPGPHKIQGIGAGFIPANLDLKLVDKVIGITNEEAISTARRLMEEEGILAGISSGAAVAAALKLQEDESFTNKNIVVILPSSGERYLSTALFADLFTEKELQQ